MLELIGCDELSRRDRRVAEALASASPSKVKKGLLVDPRSVRLRKMKSSITTATRLFQDRLGCSFRPVRECDWRPAMVTLTYKEVDGWDPNHVRNFLTCVRQWLKRRGFKFRYVWVAELQDRGAVHYHIVIWLPRLGLGRWNFLKLPKMDEAGWWSHGSTNVCWARKAVGYVVKYASKACASTAPFPKGLRLYGIGGTIELERVELRYWRAPKFAREFLGRFADIRKVKGGYECKLTSVFCPSPWEFSGMLDGRPFFVYNDGIVEKEVDDVACDGS